MSQEELDALAERLAAAKEAVRIGQAKVEEIGYEADVLNAKIAMRDARNSDNPEAFETAKKQKDKAVKAMMAQREIVRANRPVGLQVFVDGKLSTDL